MVARIKRLIVKATRASAVRETKDESRKRDDGRVSWIVKQKEGESEREGKRGIEGRKGGLEVVPQGSSGRGGTNIGRSEVRRWQRWR